MLKEIEYGKEAIDYIMYLLENEKTLSRYLLHLPLAKGHVIGFVPEDLKADDLGRVRQM